MQVHTFEREWEFGVVNFLVLYVEEMDDAYAISIFKICSGCSFLSDLLARFSLFLFLWSIDASYLQSLFTTVQNKYLCID